MDQPATQRLHAVREPPRPHSGRAAKRGIGSRGSGALAALCALAALAGGVGAARAEAVDVELVLAADGSGSIDDDELALQRAGYAAAIGNPEVLSAIRSGAHGRIAVAYVEWGAPESQHVIVDWTVIDGADSARAFADALVATPRAAFGYNSISNAIHFSTDMILGNAHEGTRKIIDVSGDGPQIGGRPLAQVRERAVLAGITINGLVIDRPGGSVRGPGGMPLDLHYRLDVIDGVGAFVMVARDRASFAEAIRAKMAREIAAAPDGPARQASRGAAPAPD